MRVRAAGSLFLFASVTMFAGRARAQRRDLEVLDVGDGQAAYYLAPMVRRTAHPVFAYMHGRGAIPRDACERFARVAPDYGWLLCPAGWENRGGETRGWGNDSNESERTLNRAI